MLTEEEAKAKFRRDLALAEKLSFDTVQPASREYAEHWSCVENNIIDLDADVEITAAPAPPPVKEEEEEPAEAPPQQEAREWNNDDWDRYYWTGE